MTNMIPEATQCPVCGMLFDANYAEGEMDICPYCEREREARGDG